MSCLDLPLARVSRPFLRSLFKAYLTPYEFCIGSHLTGFARGMVRGLRGIGLGQIKL